MWEIIDYEDNFIILDIISQAHHHNPPLYLGYDTIISPS
jgi:hypothetical protein